MNATSTSQTLLILGGTSDIGRATARAFAQKGWTIQLAGRDNDALDREGADIAVRFGTSVSQHRFDVLDTQALPAFLDGLPALPHVVVCVVGLLGDQARAERDPDHATAILRSNFEGPALVLAVLAERFVARGHGTIVGVSSVAGDRGRASNYVYGAAKAGLTAFLSGLRNRLAKRGVHVVTVKPGFVRTRMTEGLKLPGPLTAEADEVGAAIWRAVAHRRDVVYVRPVWRVVMAVIRALPEAVFKKTSI